MTVRLSQLAQIDWKKGVPNAKGELNNKDIDNLRYVITHIESTGTSKDAILTKCWKYISNLDSPEKIIQATNIIMPKYLAQSPRIAIKFLDNDDPENVCVHNVRLVKKLAPNLDLKKISYPQFNKIISLLYDQEIKLSADDLLQLEKIADQTDFQELKAKLIPIKLNLAKNILESKVALTSTQISDLADLFSNIPSEKRIDEFDRVSNLILTGEAKFSTQKLGTFFKTFSMNERRRFIALLNEHLKEKDDDTYIFWHQLMDKNGMYDDRDLKEGIPFYAMDKLLEKSEYLRSRENFKGVKEPLNTELLFTLLQAEYPYLYHLPKPAIDKNNVSIILEFLSLQNPADLITSKSKISQMLLEIINSLDPKNRDDLIVAVNIQNYLTAINSKEYESALKEIFNRQLEERRDLTYWEKIVTALVSFFGMAVNEWVKVDKTYLLEMLNQVDKLDLKLTPQSTVELWKWITSHKSLRSLDLSEIEDLPDESVLELPLTLEHLDLSGNKVITDKVVEHIKKMPNLKSINFRGTNLSYKAKIELACLIEPVDLREFPLTDELIEMIPISAKTVLLGSIPLVTLNGFAHLVKLQDLRHLELGSIPEGKPLLLHGVLTLPKLSSLKLVGIKQKYDDISIIFYQYKIQTLILDSCEFAYYNNGSGYGDQGGNKVDATVKFLTVINSKIPAYYNIISSLEELRLFGAAFDRYQYFDIFENCKNVIVESEAEKSRILTITGVNHYSYSNYISKIIVQENSVRL